MRIAYDCEFLEDGHTIELISIAMVAEDGRQLYLVNRDFRWRRIAHRLWWAPWRWKAEHQWLADNVVPHLPNLHGDPRLYYARRGPLGLIDWQSPMLRSRDVIAARVQEFVQATPDAELWADYGAYDHVVLCQLYGPMIALPDGFPMWTHDFQQVHEAAGRPELPEHTSGLHNALADAQHLMECMRAVTARAEEP